MWRDDEIKVDIPEGAEVVYTTPSVIIGLDPIICENNTTPGYSGHSSFGVNLRRTES
jgi:hypothetical protein